MGLRAKGIEHEAGITEINSPPPEGLGVHGAWSMQPTVEIFPCLSYYLSRYYNIQSHCGRRIFVINVILSIFDTSK
jgi:hypothetical protein